MYEIATIQPKELKKVKIRKQGEIMKATGLRLDLAKAYEEMKKETNNFSLDVEEAKKVDLLFHQLLQKNGIEKGKSTVPKKKEMDTLQMRERERVRTLELLELELELEAAA